MDLRTIYMFDYTTYPKTIIISHELNSIKNEDVKVRQDCRDPNTPLTSNYPKKSHMQANEEKR